MKARIDFIPDAEAGVFVRLIKWLIQKRTRLNQKGESWNLMAHHKGVMYANLGYMAMLDNWKKVPRRLKRLIHLRVAMRVGCPA